MPEFRALIIDPRNPDNDGPRQLTETTLAEHVRDDIEIAYGYRRPDGELGHIPRVAFIFGENTKLHPGWVPNPIATTLWWHYDPRAARRDVLAGPVIIAGVDHAELGPLPEDVAEAYLLASLARALR